MAGTSAVGSNLDVNGIVSQLMQLEQRPLVNLEKKKAGYEAKLSAIGNLKGALSTFQTAVKSLADAAKFQAVKVTAADTAIASATGTAAAVPGTYALEVAQLAQAQKLASAGQASSSAAIGIGVITFDFGSIIAGPGSFDPGTGKYTGASFTTNGSGAKTVTIDSSNNSLSGIRDAINKADIGVTASIVNDGSASPYRLVLTEKSTGRTNSMKISVAGDPALGNLLNHDPGAAQAFSETATAQNAEFMVDGIPASKSTNSISDMIPGVTLNLAKKTSPGSPTSITVARDTSSVSSAVGQFVSAYNQINKTLKDLSAYNSTTKQAAVLNGDSAVRSIQTQLRGVLNEAVGTGTGSFSLLYQIGVTFQQDGTLQLDNTKLQKAINEHFEDIAGLFASMGKASDSLVSYSGASNKTIPGSYAVNVTQLATQGTTTGQQPVTGLTIDASNDTLDVKLDGVTKTINLTQKTYADPAALAAELQAKINGVSAFSDAESSVTVTESAGVLTIRSARYGSTSNVSITGGNGKNNLVGATPTLTNGLDVAGTINGAIATGSGQTLTGAADNPAEGLKLKITGTSTGNRGTVNYSKGYASQFELLLNSLLEDNGTISSRTKGINESLKSLDKQRDQISNRLVDIEKRYRAQFTALDVALGKMSKTSSYLQQQLANLPKIE